MSGICYKPAEIYLGIDLGTTNSCACLSTDGFRQNVVDFHGSSLLPSYAQFKRGKPIVIGNMAKKSASNKKASVVYNTKRAMGRSFNDPEVQKMKDNFGSPIINKDGYPYFQISATGELQSPTDIGTKIVQHIIERANEKSDSKVTHVCITVPAYFDENQRSATLQCVLNCGFTADQVEVLNEPTAAAITYINENNFRDGYLLVYDLGGGTFDVSIVEVRNNECTVKSYAGDNCLGGSDFDKAVADLIIQKYTEITCTSLFDGRSEESRVIIQRRLLLYAEQAKICLSQNEETAVDIRSIVGFEIVGVNHNDDDDDEDDEDDIIIITQEEMNEKISAHIETTIVTVQEALHKADLSAEQISKVILAGGSSNLPIIQTKLSAFFNGQVDIVAGVNRNECIAAGACWFLDHPIALKEVTAFSLGQKVHGNKIQWLIPAGKRLPCDGQATTYFIPDTKNPKQLVISALYQGHETIIDNTETPIERCICLHPYSFSAYYPTPKLMRIVTYFHIESNGIVYVTVENKSTKTKLLDNFKIEY